jgi:hypothetical protein
VDERPKNSFCAAVTDIEVDVRVPCWVGAKAEAPAMVAARTMADFILEGDRSERMRIVNIA